MSLSGNKSKTSSSSNYSGSSSTSYNPAFQNQLQERLNEISGRKYQALDPNAYKTYESPYQQEVIDATTADINANRGLAKTQLQADQAGAKAFDNDRRGIAQAQLEGEFDRTLASTLAALRSQGYSQSVGIAQGENTNANAYQGQQDTFINQLLAMLAQGNQTTTNSGTQSGKGSSTSFGFEWAPKIPGMPS